MKTPIFPPLSIPTETKTRLASLREGVLACLDAIRLRSAELTETENRIETLRLSLPKLTTAAADADPDSVNALVVCERQIQILQDKAKAQSAAVNTAEVSLRGALAHASNQFKALMPEVLEALNADILSQLQGFCSMPGVVNEFLGKTDAVMRFRHRYFGGYFPAVADPKAGAEVFLSYFEELLPGEIAAV